NSEVKRRSADGSVGSPHVRVGNCQASNKTKGSVERLGLLFYLLFAGKRSPGQDVRHKRPGIKSVRSPSSPTGFLRFCRYTIWPDRQVRSGIPDRCHA
ncbi:hypothetical protein CAC00_05565, partial [Raoultella ornithinolytica]